MLVKAHALVEVLAGAHKFALKCFNFTTTHQSEMKDFDMAYSHEMMAKLGALLGDQEMFDKHYGILNEFIPQIEKEGDRKWLKEDVKGGNWFGMA